LSEIFGRRKVFIIGLALYTLANGLCAAAPNFGSLLFFRFFAGLAASPPSTNSGACIGDIYPPAERGLPMAFFSLAPFCGPALGPLIGGFIGPSHLGYRWVFIVLAILTGAACIVTICFLPETYPPTLRYEKAKRLRKTGQAHMHSELDLQKSNWQSNMIVWLYRPLQMLVQEPILAVICLYLSLTFSIIYVRCSFAPGEGSLTPADALRSLSHHL
jgi:DHA1 family multidrug resistance protein-like MFS transporter